jgi:uncharacterized protein YecE (DUF72 family)
MAELKIGTCSWKYDSWRGIVYSGQKEIDYLEEYARQFDTVEIDQWFWSLFNRAKPVLPKPEVVQNYLASVPEHFKFTIKIPNSITLSHFYRKGKEAPLVPNPNFLSPQLFQDFLDTVEPMNKQIGVLIFQFEYLNKQKMPSQLEFQEKFVEFLSQIPRKYPLALEIRNPNYLNDRYFDFLLQGGVYHVFIQGYYMPPIVQVYRKHKEAVRELSVIRLMGPDRKSIEEKSGKNWGRIWESKDDELSDIITVIRDLNARGINVYVNVNNHYEGSAPLTIHKLRQMLKNSK